jgi:hypothetical protein
MDEWIDGMSERRGDPDRSIRDGMMDSRIIVIEYKHCY